MANQTDKLAFLNAQIEIANNDRLAFRSFVDLYQGRKFDVIAHISTSTVSALISRRRIGFRGTKGRGKDKSSGSISGRTRRLVRAACCPSREPIKKSIKPRRISLK